MSIHFDYLLSYLILDQDQMLYVQIFNIVNIEHRV